MHRLLLCLTVVILMLAVYHFAVAEKFEPSGGAQNNLPQNSACCKYKFGARYFNLTGTPSLLSYGIFPNITH